MLYTVRRLADPALTTDSDAVRTEVTRNPALKLLLRLVGLEASVEEAHWVWSVPRSCTPASLDRDARIIDQYLAQPLLIEGELRRRFREEFDFTMPRFDVLAQLDREPSGLVLGELPKRLMVSAGNLTPIVDRLVEDGFITRTPSNLDRRVQIVCMTVEGRKAFRRMAKSHGSWLAELLARVPADRLDGLTRELDELKGAVRDAMQKP